MVSTTISTTVWVIAGIVLLASYVTWTAGRLDRLHARVDAAWAALDAQLVRRAAAARALLALLPAGSEHDRLERAASRALDADDEGREVIENDLSSALRRAVPLLPEGEEGARALAELEGTASRVGLARSFHNSAVHDTRTLRRRRLPRALRLAGHRALPRFFDMDDTSLA